MRFHVLFCCPSITRLLIKLVRAKNESLLLLFGLRSAQRAMEQRSGECEQDEGEKEALISSSLRKAALWKNLSMILVAKVAISAALTDGTIILHVR